MFRNAKTGGMGADFGLTSNQYSVVVLIFFVSYMVFEIPSNMILNRVRPSIYLPGLAILWGTIATCMGAVQNTQQLTVLRFLLGIAEAGFAPGCTFYLSSW
jgi:MFS family permease